MEVAGLVVELPQGRAGTEAGVLLLIVDAEGLRTGGLHLALVLEDGERETYHDAVQRMAVLGVAAVAHFQSGQPALTTDGKLLLCGQTFVLE